MLAPLRADARERLWNLKFSTYQGLGFALLLQQVKTKYVRNK